MKTTNRRRGHGFLRYLIDMLNREDQEDTISVVIKNGKAPDEVSLMVVFGGGWNSDKRESFRLDGSPDEFDDVNFPNLLNREPVKAVDLKAIVDRNRTPARHLPGMDSI